VTCVVTDTGPLIHLSALDVLPLFDVFETVLVPETVLEEVERGGVPDGLSALSTERIEASDDSLAPDLDAGERATLAVALEHDATVVTDDLDARRAASRLDLDVTGSVGVIVRNYAAGNIDRETAVSLIRRLQSETSLFITDAVVEAGIELVEQS
jgi:predicted nucleic acid-binding protein